MDLAFFWMVLFVLVLILLLEAASLLPHGTARHRLALGGLILLTAGIFVAATRMMLSHQLPSFSLAPPTFYFSMPS
ncbi:MAG: hypothetical protein M1313_05315 [Nitrospirae bacterium]|jgi:hypothetical protein|nr:hypothetical protein [Nitrospirota bacterium]